MWSDMKNSLTGYLYTELKEHYIITLVNNSWQHATEKLKLSCDETKMQNMQITEIDDRHNYTLEGKASEITGKVNLF